MSTQNIYIAGRYMKYERNLSQSPWIDKDDFRVKDSVQEMIEKSLREYIGYEKSTFTSLGREDVDVRMLGRGRPFIFKLQNATNVSTEALSKAQEFVGKKFPGRIGISDLQIVDKIEAAKHMTNAEETKQKEYRAMLCCSRPLCHSDMDKISSTKDLIINQMTPIRVLHRRPLITRSRTIYQMRIEPFRRDLCCFDSRIDDRHIAKIYVLTLTTEAGTYIKEFVHGDFGRTEPNFASLLGGDFEADLIELDVMEVYSDWPPEINLDNTDQHKETEMDSPTVPDISEKESGLMAADLSELYSKAFASMLDAQKLPRGDKRQELYLESRRLFEKALTLVESLDLFSDNETSEDIATAELKYLLVPAHLAKILLSAECSPNRLETFTGAESHIVNYLRRVSQYKLADASVDRALKDLERGSGDGEASNFSAVQPSVPSLESAMRDRDAKIERYKKSKQLEDKIEELELRMKNFGHDQVDEELVREYYINMITKTTDEMLDSLLREVRPAIFFERNRSSRGDVVPSTSTSTKPLIGKTFTIVRDQFQKQVFGAGYPSQATVTVDEFITKKINDGDLAFDKHREIYTNSLQKYAEQPNLRREQEEMSDEESDLKEDRHDENELQRKRRWDEFKDDNPRGSGNRHNMG